ncbi:hypothetical protein JQC92_13930 [Shewanella sp. 202IG2-18]|uniref:hypothetical protein n=1 Tax=Parashewanella hymeniacidonis TaxID=2807618 RepID=UPI001960D50A|nr:hypothetical protein [Parashewanella hymeniacidonis]MBM7073113.1 hypothetical protein [Parashewanella hymeniacidonis]
MHHQLNQWLKELDEEVTVISSNDINEEASANMLSFGCSEDSLKEWGKESLCEFLEACSEIYSSKSNDLQMILYVWLDEMAGQFRISAVSEQ